MVGLLGRKFGMTQIYDSKGNCVPVTVLEVGPCLVTNIRTKEKNGYSAVQLGYCDIEERKLSKSVLGKFKTLNVPIKKYLREIRTEKIEGLKVGDRILVDTFQAGEYVDISGISIGKGFQGVVKRHHFVGGKRSHGSMFGRVPGSIGASSFPSRVVKGMRAAGHMGDASVTIQNIEIVDVHPEKNILVIKGQVPGVEGRLLIIRNSKKRGKKDKTWKVENQAVAVDQSKPAPSEKSEESKES